MQITVAVVMCNTLAAAPMCHEQVVTQGDMTMMACVLSQAALAKWKSESIIYRGDEWRITRIKCVVGTYVARTAI
jgi:hypothetical protein